MNRLRFVLQAIPFAKAFLNLRPQSVQAMIKISQHVLKLFLVFA